MVEATVFFCIFALVIGLFGYFGYRKAKKDPQNAGLEPGAILIKSFINYSLTYFIGLQLAAMISEAALLGSVQDKDINVAARMTVHVVMAIISAFGAFAMTKYFGSLVSVLIQKRPFGVKIGLVSLLLTLSFISLGFTIGAPLYNLSAMANSLHQTTQLELFWDAVKVSLGWQPEAYLAYKIRINHLPEDYAPFASLHSGMVTSIGITVFHIMLTIWECLVSLMLALTHQGLRHAVMADLFDVKVDSGDSKGDDKGKKEGEKDKKDEEKDKHNPKDKSAIEGLLKAYGIEDKKLESWVNTLLELTYDKAKNKPNVERHVKIIELNEAFKSDKGKPSRLEEHRSALRKLIHDWTGGQKTLPEPKKD